MIDRGVLRVRTSLSRALAAVVAASVALSWPGTGASSQEAVSPRARKDAVLATEFPVAAHRLADIDGDGRSELIVIGKAGEVRVWRHDPATGRPAAQPSGILVLPYPQRSLVAVGDLLGVGTMQLVVLSQDGLVAHEPSEGGGFSRAGVLVSKLARFPLRTGAPRFADILRDVNGDRRPDVIVPGRETVELWLHTDARYSKDPLPEGAAPAPLLRKAVSMRVDVSRERSTEHEALSDVLESSFRIPALRFTDVNGDGRDDLVVEEGKKRAWHLSKPEGTFPELPDVKVDLESFKDTTLAAEVKLGRTLAGSDEQRIEARDLNGDAVPDYVIAHRRKIWVCHGGPAGPDFVAQKQVLVVADDVTAILLVKLDGDAHADLVVLRIQVPTVAALLRGLVAQWDVDITALGYANNGDGTFQTSPKWRGTLAIRLPAILGVLKDPDALVRRFEDVSKKFGAGIDGDFDGDGRDDLAIAEPDRSRVRMWFARPGTKDDDAEKALAEAFFGADDRVWDLDRLLGWLGSLADRRAARLTGGREPDGAIELRKPHEAEYLGVSAADMDGAKGAEIVVAYELPDGRAAFEIWKSAAPAPR